MYQLKTICFEQMNIAAEFSGKPGMEHGMHWLNPLFIKCKASGSPAREPGL